MRKTLPEKLELGRIKDGFMGSTKEWGATGAFFVQGPCGEQLKIVASDGTDITPWEHVSVSTRRRPPNWQEMCFIKDMFWDEEETVIQFHPPKSEYVNNHPYCLHLWRPLEWEIKLPPSELVGDKNKGTLDAREAEMLAYYGDS